jgi:YidC/Oxa1 family membrane protein insertase
MDKKTITGFLLIFGLLMLIQYVNKPSQEEIENKKRISDSIAVSNQQALAESRILEQQMTETTAVSTPISDSVADTQNRFLFGPLASFAHGEENEFKLENEDIEITFSNKGGRIKNVRLKKYESWLRGPDNETMVSPVDLLGYPADKFEFLLPVTGAQNNLINSDDLYFDISQSGSEIIFRVDNGAGISFEQIYSIDPSGYKIDYQIRHRGLNLVREDKLTLNWTVYLTSLEKSVDFEKTYATVYFKRGEKVDHLSFSKTDKEKYDQGNIHWISNVNQFFNSTIMDTDQRFSSAEVEIVVPGKDEVTDYLKISRTKLEFPPTDNFAMQFYVGPNEYSTLKSFGNGMEMVIAFGWNIFGTINRWVVRPLLLFFYNIVGSMGIAIIVMIFIIKGLLSPLNHKMLLSGAKMQALKPEIEKLKEKHKDDAQQQQLRTMEMYRKYGVSPFGGCLPMLLQMPIWIALFRFFPAAIEFRQIPFLWAPDLSSYEAVAYLPFSIPMYGSHISLFALLWGISSVIYAHFSMKSMDMGTGQTQAMKYMQYTMPVFFIVFFNSYASGLNVYMFFNNLFTIAQTTITKNFVFDQEKIREKLELNKDKPKKKSKFTQKLEEAMKQQQEIAEKKKRKK